MLLCTLILQVFLHLEQNMQGEVASFGCNYKVLLTAVVGK